MPIPAREDAVCQVSDPLLQARHERTDPLGDEICRPPDDVPPSPAGISSPDRWDAEGAEQTRSLFRAEDREKTEERDTRWEKG